MKAEEAKKILAQYKNDPSSLSFDVVDGAVKYLSAVKKGEILKEALEYIVKLGMKTESDTAKDALIHYKKEI